MASSQIELIQSLLGKKGVYNIKNITCNDQPDDFNLGTYATAVVKFTNERQDLHLFLKICEQNTFVDQVRTTLLTYEKEIIFYDEILPSLIRFDRADRKDGSSGSVGELFVDFYGVGHVRGNTCLVMERFSKDYYMKVKEEFHNYNEVVCALKHIATFHATSFSMKTLQNIHFPTTFPILTEKVFQSDCPLAIKSFFVGSFDANVKLMRNIIAEVKEGNPAVARYRSYLQVLDNNVIDRLEGLSANLWSVMCSIATHETNTSVICHGDYHMGNIAFHRVDANAMKMFDFQVTRYASPLTDVQQYLFQVTTPTTREKHLTEFISVYRNTFQQACENLGVGEKSSLFTQELVDEEYSRLSLWGFSYGFMFITRRFVSADDWIKISACSSSWEVVSLLDFLKLWDVVQIYFDLLLEAQDNKTFDRMQLVLSHFR